MPLLLQTLPQFGLTDQFGRTVSDASYKGVAIIIVVGNRHGARSVAAWTSALRAVIGDARDKAVLAVADLGGVPRLVRPMVRRLLPREQTHWCALDWDGHLGPLIRQHDESLAAATFDVNRNRRYRGALPLEVTSELLVQLIEQCEGPVREPC